MASGAGKQIGVERDRQAERMNVDVGRRDGKIIRKLTLNPDFRLQGIRTLVIGLRTEDDRKRHCPCGRKWTRIGDVYSELRKLRGTDASGLARRRRGAGDVSGRIRICGIHGLRGERFEDERQS